MGIAHVRALALALAVTSSAAMAHEIGTTQVNARFGRDHTYRIDVVTAPQSLLEKIEHRRFAPLAPADLQGRLQADAAKFAGNVEVRFGGERVSPRVDVLPIVAGPQQAQAVTMRLSGEIPPLGETFTWRYGLTYSVYSLELANEGRGEPMRQWLESDSSSAPFPLSKEVLPPTRAETIQQYLGLGFTHIVPYGLDHILFVLGIFLLTTKLKPILAQVTAFTIAHSITLGLTIYGLVSVSPRLVEPAIALSIAYVAIENLITSELKPWRVGIVFGFGLLHGMGFAGVLKELGLPRSQFLTALITFNVGVEAGQLTVIAAAFLLIAYWHRAKPWYRERFVVPASALIALTGLFWTVQRAMS